MFECAARYARDAVFESGAGHGWRGIPIDHSVVPFDVRAGARETGGAFYAGRG